MKRAVIVAFVILLVFLVLFLALPNLKLSIISALIGLIASIIFLVRIWRHVKHRSQPSRISLTISWLIFILTPFFFLILVLALLPLSIASIYWAIALSGLTFTFFYDLVHLPLALYHKYQEVKRVVPKDLPPISFIVPAYNEEKCLARTLISLLEVNYPKKEIIVVNDGSTDNTGQIAESFSPQGVIVVNQPNRGKAVAINTGLVYATGEIIITVDADSLIERNGLRSVISRFEDPKVMAVCGNVKVLNRVNLLTRCQALEYILDINLAKRAFDLFGSTMVVPGVFGAFRRQVLKRGGRFDVDTVTEDFDTTVKALKAGGVVQATSFAVSYTEAPENLRDLYKQRLRWYRGTFQTLLKHRDVLNNPRFGLLSELGFPYILLSMIFVPWAGLGALISGLVAMFTGFWLEFLILLFLFIALETLLSLFSILLDEEDIRLLIYAPLFVIGYRQWRDAVKVKAMFDVFLRKRFEWSRVQRIGRAEEIVKRYKQKG